ncbi:MAG TPA: beta-N-acetylhexosaminidase [Chitinophagaceae bacterium]|jgi:hexosaminidase|nr:beta-N-acetylhexosaminidase [Chitinophagaceae bacterium]
MLARIVFLIAFFTVIILPSSSQVSIIPEPVSLQQKDGNYSFKDKITVGGDASAKKIIDWLKEKLSVTGLPVSIAAANEKADILFSLNKTANATIGKEGYQLIVSANDGVKISANEPAGLFYGTQTLLQLLPPAIESKSTVKDITWSVPVVEVTDYPRFGWRGLMFDVSRHFFGVKDVKEFIDDMAAYKYNLLHLHLTDDQGWRIEIKSLPKLTSVGAWNVQKTGTFGTFSKPEPNEPRNFGGFFTHNDIKELVQYAKDRFINIMPEVDMPGHSLAAIAAYPDLTCTPGTYQVNSGEQFMVWPPSGHFYGLIDNTLCPANERTFVFIDKVFTEIAQLFPFEYIHMGGDETARNFWEKSDAIKALMKKQNLKNLDEVQSYFVKRVEKIINSKGKKMIGWDEILDGGLAPNAAVMSWRGMKGGIEAAKLGHEVVMSPTTYAYIDYMQGDAMIEPPVYATLRLSKAYEFEPVPDGVDAKYIKGGQANLWTEQVYNMRHLRYMVWPRGFAIAESLWSPKNKKNWNNFYKKVESHFPRFDAAQKKYAPSMYDPEFKFTKNDKNEITVEMKAEVPDLSVHYSFDNSFPDNFYPQYSKPVIVPKDAATMKVVTYRGDKQMGRLVVFPSAEMKKRAGVKDKM